MYTYPHIPQDSQQMWKTNPVDMQHTKSGCNYASQVTYHNNSESKSNFSGACFVSSIRKKIWLLRHLWSHSFTLFSLSLTHKSRPNLQEQEQPVKNTR